MSNPLGRLDRGTLFGVLTAVIGVTAGLYLDGGNLGQVLQPTAALIVLGGTVGAVLIQFPYATVKAATISLRQVFFDAGVPWQPTIDELVICCTQARRQSILSLDARLQSIEDDFMRKSLTLVVDGASIADLRAMMELDLEFEDEREHGMVSVMESAGGFAPTLGIIGAVLGLIQVMQRMNNVAEIGKGIAVAFVSTLYGLGLANLILLPMAGKLRAHQRERYLLREMTLEAVVSIVEGISARGLRERLRLYPMAQIKRTAQPVPVFPKAQLVGK
jgi:chemotaxis protein MotA